MADRGDVLGGRYRLVEKIGEGGMGTVWGARDAQDNDAEVAVKLLHKTLVGDDAAVERFRHEAHTTARITHPNICRVRDVGGHDGVPYLVMERLRGESLAERLSRAGRLPPREAAGILLDALAGVEAAHQAGVLHRDLKPENVFLARGAATGEIVPRILDFGVAKVIGDDAARVKLTRTGALVGTPAYMSPEQARGLEQVDVRSDVWAAGVILYEVLAGRLPYEAPNYNAMLVRIATERPRPLAEVAARPLDPALVAIVDRALAANPADRYPSAAAMADALRAWLDGRAVAPTLPGVSLREGLPTPSVATTPMSWAETAGGAGSVTFSGVLAVAGRRGWLRTVVLAAAVGAAAVVVVHGARRSNGGRAGAHAAMAATTASSTAASSTAANPNGRVGGEVVARSEHEVRLEGLPPGAVVALDGVVASGGVLRVRHGERAHIEVTAPGYDRWAQTVTATGDVAVTYAGQRAASATSDARVAEATGTPGAAVNNGAAGRSSGAAHAHGGRGGGRRRGGNGQRGSGGIATNPDF